MLHDSKKISKESKSSFYYAFNLLPADKRDAMNDIYAFCRYTDDIVDNGNEPDEVKYEKLRKWRVELERAITFKSNLPLLNKVSKSIQKYNIPLEPFYELIRGMEMDLQNKRYFTFNDLQTYCYRVASTVGLMCIEIFGYKHPSIKNYAVNLGMALQLTNILRDVKTDAANGRIYLPKEDMDHFNYSEQELINNVYNDNFVLLMRYEASKARKYFEEADKHLRFDDKPAMFAARAMQHIYSRLLSKLEAENFNVFEKNIKVSKIDKTFFALGVWAKYKLVY